MSRQRTNPIKVLQVGPLPPPVGGMATVVSNLDAALQGSCEIRTLNNVKTTPKGRTLFQGVAAQLRLLMRLARYCLVWRPRIVHIHTCSWFSFWRSAVDVVLARLLGRQVVLHIHGAEFRTFLDSLPFLKARLLRLVLGLCGSVVVLGQGWKDLLDRWCDPERVVAVPNGVPLQPERKTGGDTVFTIVCLANYERRKGQMDLLRALETLSPARPVRVALLGFEAEPGQRQSLMDLARELGLAGQVEIPGPVMGAEKEAWWTVAACFCLPSYDEGLPMSMLEAMARGLPVIATRVGAIPEAVENGREGLLYEPGDIPALAGHLKTLLDDPIRAREIGRGGRERLVRDFTLERCAEKLLSIYRGLAAS